MLSILRRISFIGIVFFLIIFIPIPLAICVGSYLFFVICTAFYCKFSKREKMNFIEVIVRQDLCDPFIRHTTRLGNLINRFFSAFFFRKEWKRSGSFSFKDKVKLFLTYLIVLFLGFIVLCGILGVFGIL